jgi:capsid portal protein
MSARKLTNYAACGTCTVNLPALAQDTPAVRTFQGLRQQSQSHRRPVQIAYGVGQGSWQALHEPPYSFYALMRMPQDNSILNQCIDAMVTNIDGHGYRFEYIGEETDGEESSPRRARRRS